MQAADLLVHRPYESFDATVEHFIAAAADDPDTVALKMTAYRIGDDTPFVKSLIRAAEHGKQVACVMEIKAQSLLGGGAGAGWRARHLRRERTEDSCQDGAGGP